MNNTQSFTPKNSLQSLQEEWRAVIGFEGFYEVSNLGRIKSFHKRNGTTRKRILEPYQTGKYFGVDLCRENKIARYKIHRLVAIHFIGPIPDGKEVNHLDGDKENNAISNLEYVTRLENVRHALRLGLRKLRAEDAPNVKLNWSKVNEIRKLAADGVKKRDIAKQFKIHPVTA